MYDLLYPNYESEVRQRCIATKNVKMTISEFLVSINFAFETNIKDVYTISEFLEPYSLKDDNDIKNKDFDFLSFD